MKVVTSLTQDINCQLIYLENYEDNFLIFTLTTPKGY